MSRIPKRIYYYDESILTLETLKDRMAPHSILAEGYGVYPELLPTPIHWVAVRGEIDDWALYYHHYPQSTEYVIASGDKAFTESIIRTLIPCTDETFKKYRK